VTVSATSITPPTGAGQGTFIGGASGDGVVQVTVPAFPASIGLREIRESDNARIKHRRFAEGTEEEVPYEKIIKAYELTPGQYVPLSKDEMAALAPEKTRAIDVQDFVDIEEIDPMYFDSPYYLGPADGAERLTRCWPARWRPPARSRSPASSSATRSTWRRCAPRTAC